MDAWIKFLVDVLITDQLSRGGLYDVSFYGDWYDAIVPRWYFKGRFHYCYVMLLLKFLV